jgi:hypothetical protein
MTPARTVAVASRTTLGDLNQFLAGRTVAVASRTTLGDLNQFLAGRVVDAEDEKE